MVLSHTERLWFLYKSEGEPNRVSITPSCISNMVKIRTHEGLCIQKKGLNYQRLKTLVEKQESLC